MKKALFIAALAFWFGPVTSFAASVASPSGLSSKSALPEASQAAVILKFVPIDVSTCRTVALQIPGTINANQFFRTCMVSVPDNATIIGITAYTDAFVTDAVTGAVAGRSFSAAVSHCRSKRAKSMRSYLPRSAAS